MDRATRAGAAGSTPVPVFGFDAEQAVTYIGRKGFLLAAAAGAGLSPAYQPTSVVVGVVSDVTAAVVALLLVAGAYRLAGAGAAGTGRAARGPGGTRRPRGCRLTAGGRRSARR